MATLLPGTGAATRVCFFGRSLCPVLSLHFVGAESVDDCTHQSLAEDGAGQSTSKVA